MLVSNTVLVPVDHRYTARCCCSPRKFSSDLYDIALYDSSRLVCVFSAVYRSSIILYFWWRVSPICQAWVCLFVLTRRAPAPFGFDPPPP